MAMDKQTRLTLERLTAMEAKLDALIAMLTPAAQKDPAKDPDKVASQANQGRPDMPMPVGKKI